MKKTKLPKIIVNESGIHGKGVYAKQPITKGQRIIEYKGERISTEEGDLRSDMHPELTYIFNVSKKKNQHEALGNDFSSSKRNWVQII